MYHLRLITIDSLRGLLIMIVVLIAVALFGVFVKKKLVFPDYLKWVLLGLAMIFAFWAYMKQPVYYFPNNNGVLGDNYYHMTRAMEKDNYLKPHHVFFPWIAEKYVKMMTSLGFASENDNDYYEKVYKWSTFPVRVFSIIALFAFSLMIYQYNKSTIDAFLVFFFTGLCYSFWIFGIQSNSIGIALSVQLLSLVLYTKWWNKINIKYTIALCLLTCFGVFFHIGVIYFSLGMFIAFLYGILVSEKKLQEKVRHISIYGIIGLGMAFAFYVVQLKLNRVSDYTGVFHVLADTDYAGEFSSPQYGYFNAFMAGIYNAKYTIIEYLSVQQSSIYMPVNFFNNLTKTDEFAERYATSLLFGLGASVFITLRRSFKYKYYALFVVGAFTYLTTQMGFVLRNPDGHYYAFLLAPTIGLFFSLFLPYTAAEKKEAKTNSVIDIFFGVFKRINNRFVYVTTNNVPKPFHSGLYSWWDTTRRLSLFGFLLLLFYYHGFSPIKLTRGTDISSHPFYRINNTIHQSVGREQAVCLHEIDENYYPNSGIKLFYNHKFGNIKWHAISPENNNKTALTALINKYSAEGYKVFIDGKRYKIISEDTPPDASQVGDSLWLLN